MIYYIYLTNYTNITNTAQYAQHSTAQTAQTAQVYTESFCVLVRIVPYSRLRVFISYRIFYRIRIIKMDGTGMRASARRERDVRVYKSSSLTLSPILAYSRLVYTHYYIIISHFTVYYIVLPYPIFCQLKLKLYVQSCYRHSSTTRLKRTKAFFFSLFFGAVGDTNQR